MFRQIQCLAVVAISLLASTVFAQETSPRMTGGFTPSFPNTPPENIHRHSSTAAEGYLRGRAVLVQAEANAALQLSQAAILSQQAESLHYDNYLKRTATAVTRKVYLQDYRDQQRGYEKARRAAAQEEMKDRIRDLAETYRLAEHQLNWETGEIAWPQKLTSARYTKHRQKMEAILEKVTRYGIRADRYYRNALVKAQKSFRRQLREDFYAAVDKGFDPSKAEYNELQRFLLGLKYAPELLDVPAANAIAMN